MKTTPVIRIENPPAGSVPATIDQLHALGLTDEDIEAGEKRLDSTHRGPWSICTSLRGLVERAEFDGSRSGTKNWVEFYTPRTMGEPRESGYQMEGRVSLAGRKVRAFTSSVLFELPDGRLINCGVIFACK